MSAEDIALLERAYAARDLQVFRGFLHEDAVLHQAPEMPDSDSYFGKDEFLRGLTRWLEGWERFRYDPVEIIEAPNGIFMRINLVGTAKISGANLEQEIFNIWRMRDGLAWECHVFWTESLARAQAGIAA